MSYICFIKIFEGVVIMESIESIVPMKCYTLDLYQMNQDMKNAIKKSFKRNIESGYVLAAVVTTDINSSLAGLDKAGYQILNILYDVGFWVITVKCVYEIIQSAMRGDRKAVGNTIITYVIVYGSLFFVPWALKLVRGIF